MKNIIELNIEIDASSKMIFIGEENSSGVEEKYNKFEEISKHIESYLEMYHRKEIEESGKLMTIKEDAEYIYQFLKKQKGTEWNDIEDMKMFKDKRYILPGDTKND